MILVSLLSTAFAAEPNCIPVPFKTEGKNIVLPGTQDSKKSVVYFFQNKSLQSIWIDHPVQNNPGMSAGWASYLRSGNWSAIVLNKKNFSVSCSMIQPGKVEPMDCSKILSICTPQNMSTAKPLNGNAWLAEDKKWDGFIKALEKRGSSFN
jgi:hypothetical protein